MNKRILSALFASTCMVAGGVLFHAGPAAAADIQIVADDIGGVVTSSKGPEAGVWVIAETEDFKTRLIKEVVTDDQGRYLLPQLPKAKYKVWVRGYGLVDSTPVDAQPGKRIDLKAVIAPDAKSAAQYYPPDYWYALIHPPAASEFPGTGADGNGIAPIFKTQQAFLTQMKEGCNLCHQLGDKATRELANPTPDGWSNRISQARPLGDAAVGNLGKSYSHDMQNNMARYGRARGLAMFADWTKRVMDGELPKEAPPRPQGMERNMVVTVWDWANGHQIHDEIATDRRNPTVNANGPVYGVSPSNGYLEILNPGKTATDEVPIPGDGKAHDINAYVHNPMLDSKGRVWMTDSSRGRQMASMQARGENTDKVLGNRADYCSNAANDAFAKYYPMTGRQTSLIDVYDPATKKVTTLSTCYGIHHLDFGRDKDNTLYFSGDGNVIGWVDTKVWDETHDVQKAEGWCPMVLDTKEKGVTKVALGDNDVTITPDRSQWNEPGKPADPKKDTRLGGGSYGMDVSPKDGAMWFAQPGFPSGLVRFDKGSHPPETCHTEYYQPPKLPNGDFAAFDGRSPSLDTNGIVWTAFTSGKIGRFDRSKCKVMNGPTATGQHCPEGWTLYDVPGPRITGTDAQADYFYLNWVDQFDTLGLGKDTPLAVGSNSDSLVAIMPDTGKVLKFRVAYPMGFYSRGMDGRIDDPKTGWKGKGVWASMGTFPVWHQEGGNDGYGPEMVHFQMRPDPLAH